MDNISQVFIQSKGKIYLTNSKPIFLKDIIHIYADSQYQTEIENMIYFPNNKKMKVLHLASVFSIIDMIKRKFPGLSLNVIGEPEILIHLQSGTSYKKDSFKLIRVIIVCFLLFIGSMTAVINFHSDVDMRRAHKAIYRIVTGTEPDNLLLMQIPYSLGIGLGMSVFFNHILKKRINNEPSPLEVEMYLYQQNMDEYTKNSCENEHIREE